MKGNVKKGIEPTLWDIPEDHDASDKAAAYDLLQQGGIPVGVVYNDESRLSMDQQMEKLWEKTSPKSVESLMDAFKF